MTDRVAEGSGLYIAWAVFAAALIIAGTCIQEGDAQRIVLAPGEATPSQVEAAATEMEMLMRDAGISDEQIARVVRRMRCKYLPETEGCDGQEAR